MGGAAALLPILGASLGSQTGPFIGSGLEKIFGPGGTKSVDPLTRSVIFTQDLPPGLQQDPGGRFDTLGNILGGIGGTGLGVGAASLLGRSERDRPPQVSSNFSLQKFGPIAAPRLDFSTIGAPRGAIGVQNQRLLELLRSRGLV